MESALSTAIRFIQLALTPVFLLIASASLLGVFSTRLMQVSDRIRELRQTDESQHKAIARLKTRSRILDVAVVLTTLAGALTSCSAIILFLDSLRGSEKAALLFVIFGAALGCTVASLACYVVEVVLAGRALRESEFF